MKNKRRLTTWIPISILFYSATSLASPSTEEGSAKNLTTDSDSISQICVNYNSNTWLEGQLRLRDVYVQNFLALEDQINNFFVPTLKSVERNALATKISAGFGAVAGFGAGFFILPAATYFGGLAAKPTVLLARVISLLNAGAPMLAGLTKADQEYLRRVQYSTPFKSMEILRDSKLLGEEKLQLISEIENAVIPEVRNLISQGYDILNSPRADINNSHIWGKLKRYQTYFSVILMVRTLEVELLKTQARLLEQRLSTYKVLCSSP